jgi:hypothetical protein
VTRRIPVLVALALASRAGAQEIVLSGTVRATDGAPLRGVSVHLVDTQLRAMTDADGKYSLNVPTDGVVAFTLTGRRPRQLQVNGRTTIDATMELDPFWSRGVFPGTAVRVTTCSKTYEGSFVRLAGERFIVESATGADSIEIPDIEIMWKKVPAVERGARVGLALGALTAGIVTHLETRNARKVCLLNGGVCGPEARATYVAFSAVLGGAGGAVLGAAIGRSFAVWSRIRP